MTRKKGPRGGKKKPRGGGPPSGPPSREEKPRTWGRTRQVSGRTPPEPDRGAARIDAMVIEAVRRAQGEPISLGDIVQHVGPERISKEELRPIVKRLIREGKLEGSRGAGLRIPGAGEGGVRVRGRRSHGSPAEPAAGREAGRGRGARRDAEPAKPGSAGRKPARDVVEGRVSVHERGFGFLSQGERGEDLFLSPGELAGVLDGDTVRAEVMPGRDGRLAGRVLAILERARTRVTGLFRRGPHGGEVIPDGGTFRQKLLVEGEETRDARRRFGRNAPRGGSARGKSAPGGEGPERAADGDVVTVEITEYPTKFRPGSARLLEVLGEEGDPAVEVERIIRRHNLPVAFPGPVLREAEGIPSEVRPADVAGRRDLRNEPIVTIDGETAKDFDDAVSVAEEAGGVLRLWVSIADVAHYVRDGSPLDIEARERGTSVYFPNRVIPMLPERLSNGICSLNPGVDRLTLTAELAITPGGGIASATFYESVIRSSARLTYTKVAAILRGETVPEIEHLRPQILLMGRAMERLRAVRHGRGSLDFDLPEPTVVIDMTTGEPDAIVRSERNDAHRLIEEMMIAANEAVARWFEARSLPSIYRVHAEPDPAKLENFALVAKSFGFQPPPTGKVSPLVLSKFLDGVEGQPAARPLNTLLLRAMMRAEYAEKNVGHFGLASSAYLHFTSPIRRYPDLMVHRLLKAHLAGAGRAVAAEPLGEIAASSSASERKADLAEYAVVDYWRARFMQDKIGEEYEGVVSGVAEFGVFVELLEFFVEGMIRVHDLSGDLFDLADTGHALVGKKSGLAFTIGDRVRVAVQSVNLSQGRIDFSLVRKHKRT